MHDSRLSITGREWRTWGGREVSALGGKEPLEAFLEVRGVIDASDPAKREGFLRPSLAALQHPRDLIDAEKAAGRILAAIERNEHIVVYGDYDVDGITATAILWHMLRELRDLMKKSGEITTYVPHRIEEGYGLNADALTGLRDRGAKLIVTVDCGVSAIDPAAHAKSIALDLIITDHHPCRLDGQLPDALAVVHPQIPGSTHRFKELCGASVAWKFAWMIAVKHCGSDTVAEVLRERLMRLVPLAALGTIADIVPLKGENRVITAVGLKAIRSTEIAGLDALLPPNRTGEEITAEAIAFRIAPRLNACGRLGHAEEAIELFTTADAKRSLEIVRTFEKLNVERKEIEAAVFAQVCVQLQDPKNQTAVIVLADNDWHPGVIGITCSKVVETFGRPCVLLGGRGENLKGSGRSLEGFELHKALEAASEHLLTHGGHSMAVGMQCEREKLGAFRDAINSYATERIAKVQPAGVIDYEVECELHELDTRMLDAMHALEPCGRGNPSPVFLVRGVEFSGPPALLGRDALHIVLQLKSGGKFLRATWWRAGRHLAALKCVSRVDLLLTPKLNKFRGRSEIEAEVVDLRVVASGSAAALSAR